MRDGFMLRFAPNTSFRVEDPKLVVFSFSTLVEEKRWIAPRLSTGVGAQSRVPQG